MSGRLTILGCGSSAGVPRVAQGWGACDPSNPRNRRRRCSILVEQTSPDGVTSVLVDTSPDLREQLLATGLERLDGILMTHSHADHTHGIDDVRPLAARMQRLVDVHMDAPTSAVVRHNFRYIFETPAGSSYPPLLNERRLTPGEACVVDGPGGQLTALPFRLEHGEIDALGFRFGDVAYTPDLKSIPGESRRFLEGLDLWIIDALRYTDHPTHFSVAEALEHIGEFQPRHAVLTNLASDLDYGTLRREVPGNVEPAWDGMSFDIQLNSLK